MKTFEVAIDGEAVEQFEGETDDAACAWAGQQRQNQSQIISVYELGSRKHETALALGRTKTPLPTLPKTKK